MLNSSSIPTLRKLSISITAKIALKKANKMFKLTFEVIAQKSQADLKNTLISALYRLGYQPQARKGFIYAPGKLPVMLVAHLDTIHREMIRTVCYSKDRNIIMSPQGIGGDDRAGVYMILRIIKKCPCHVLFCEDEEIGGVGAREFTRSGVKPNINYIVELDRRGANEAVFYECDNPDFTKMVTSFGFMEEMGSFSDISIIAPNLQVAAVNLSAGYFHEHSKHEYVDLNIVERNIERVKRLVATPSEKFEYLEASHPYRGRWDFDKYYDYLDDGEVETKMLMPLPESAHIKKPDGELIDSTAPYFLDNEGKVYKYLYDQDVVVAMNEYEAWTENCAPVKFEPKDSVEIEVVSWDDDFDLTDVA